MEVFEAKILADKAARLIGEVRRVPGSRASLVAGKKLEELVAKFRERLFAEHKDGAVPRGVAVYGAIIAECWHELHTTFGQDTTAAVALKGIFGTAATEPKGDTPRGLDGSRQALVILGLIIFFALAAYLLVACGVIR